MMHLWAVLGNSWRGGCVTKNSDSHELFLPYLPMTHYLSDNYFPFLIISLPQQVCGEIDEIQRRLTLALKERTDYLKSSVDKYVGQEMKTLKDLKDNLDLEVTNIRSNSDLMEKNLDDGTKWDDVELLDCKEIFIKMMDWIRNYDTSNEEYTRRIRFTCHDGVNDLARRVLELGDLKMQENNPSKSNDDYEPRSSGLSRSKSDHRLVSEFRRQEENSSPTRSRRAFGYSREANKSRSNMGRYGGEEEDDSSYSSSRFSSRFLSRGGGDDEGSEDRRNSRHLDEEPMSKKERNKVIETEDASRGPLSGCIRLADSSRVIQRLKVSLPIFQPSSFGVKRS